MMPSVPYLSIDSGIINDPGKKLDCLMSDFFEAEYSQSNLFHGTISSLPWILQQYQDDQSRVASVIRTTLNDYLSRYFDSVEIESGIEESESMTGYGVRIYIRVDQSVETVTLYQRLKVEGTKLIESIRIRE